MTQEHPRRWADVTNVTLFQLPGGSWQLQATGKPPFAPISMQSTADPRHLIAALHSQYLSASADLVAPPIILPEPRPLRAKAAGAEHPRGPQVSGIPGLPGFRVTPSGRTLILPLRSAPRLPAKPPVPAPQKPPPAEPEPALDDPNWPAWFQRYVEEIQANAEPMTPAEVAYNAAVEAEFAWDDNQANYARFNDPAQRQDLTLDELNDLSAWLAAGPPPRPVVPAAPQGYRIPPRGIPIRQP